LKKKPETFEDIHERMVSAYLRDHPNVPVPLAYLRTKDAAWEEATKNLEERADKLNQKLTTPPQPNKPAGDVILNKEIERKSNVELLSRNKKR